MANAGYLAARQSLKADETFYRQVQKYVSFVLRDAIRWWAAHKLIQDERFLQEWKGYEISIPAFPFVDPLKDSAALRMLKDSQVVSPQQLIRERGDDVQVVKEELRDWAAFQRELTQIAANSEEVPLEDVLKIMDSD